MKKHQNLGVVAILALATFQTSNAALLFYDGFSGADYTAGPLNGQPYVGSGYAAGTWNSNSDFVAGGLSYSTLLETPGFGLSKDTSEDIVAALDTSPGGNFGTAGLVGTDGFIGGAGVTGSLYFSVLARRDSTEATAGFAGFQVFENGAEGFGVGEFGNPTNQSWLSNGANGVIGSGTAITPGQTNLYVFRLDFDAAGTTDAQVWINPDLAVSEGAQLASTTSNVINASTTPSGGFNNLRMRGSRSRDYTFDEIRIGTTWEDVTPIPEPSSSILGLLALGGLCLRRSRTK